MAQQHDDALTLAQTYFARWNDGDFDGLRAILTDNVTIVLPMSGGDSPEPSTVFPGVDNSVGYYSSRRTSSTASTSPTRNGAYRTTRATCTCTLGAT